MVFRILVPRLLSMLKSLLQELVLYLLQLVQALKFESSPSEINVRNASRSSANRGVVNEDSGLADFLINRSVNNLILGNRFHWYLMVELENKETAKTYGRVSYKFMTRLMEVRR